MTARDTISELGRKETGVLEARRAAGGTEGDVADGGVLPGLRRPHAAEDPHAPGRAAQIGASRLGSRYLLAERYDREGERVAIDLDPTAVGVATRHPTAVTALRRRSPRSWCACAATGSTGATRDDGRCFGRVHYDSETGGCDTYGVRAPKILAVASAVDLDFRYGCTPAWWQLWKGMARGRHRPDRDDVPRPRDRVALVAHRAEPALPRGGDLRRARATSRRGSRATATCAAPRTAPRTRAPTRPSAR